MEALRQALRENAADPEALARILANEDLTDLDLRSALRGRVPASVNAFVVERSRFGARQTVLGAVARSASTAPRTALQALPGLAWRDLAEVAVAAELAPAVRQKAEALLMDGVNSMRIGDLITLARIGPRRTATRLLFHGDERIRGAGLENPRLRDTDVCEVVGSPEAPVPIAAEVLRVHRWAVSYQVRRALVRGPRTPHPISLSLIAEMNPGDLRDIARSDDVPALISAVARRILG